MPRTSEMRDSKFLRKEDVGRGLLVTVHGCEKHNTAMEGELAEHKWCLSFRETNKPLVLNSTNIQICEQVFKSDNTDDWIGKRLVLYTDPNVSFGGKLVGGIRVRAVKKSAPPPPPPPVTELDESDPDDSDIPF